MKKEPKKDLVDLKEIDNMIQEYHLENNALVSTTKERYVCETQILRKLKEDIDNLENMYTEKKYKSDTLNLYIHPSIQEYSKHTTVANNTAITLAKLIKELGCKEEIKKEVSLEELISE